MVFFFFCEFRGVKQNTCFTSFEKLICFFLFCEKVELFFRKILKHPLVKKKESPKTLAPQGRSLTTNPVFLHPQAMAIPWQKPWELWAMPRAKELGFFHLKPRLRPLRPVHVVVYLGKKGMERFEDVKKMRDVSENRGYIPPKSSIKKWGFPFFFHHPFWGTPIFGNTQMMFDIDIHGSFENHFFLGGIFKKSIFRKQVFFGGEFLHLCHPNCIFNEPTNSCDEGVIHSRWCSFICVRSGAGTTNQSIVTSTGRCHMWADGWGVSR